MNITYLQEQLKKQQLSDKIILKYVPQSLSTMEDAKEDIKHDLPIFYLAEDQKKARGRFQRPFYTERKNGIYLSVKLNNNQENLTPSQFILATTIALCKTIESYDTCLKPQIKWVNDIYIERKKCAGILAEGILNPEGQLETIVLGMGINFSIPQNNFPTEIQEKVTSIFKKPPTSPEDFFLSFIQQFLDWKNQAIPIIQETYKNYLFILNQPVTFSYNGQIEVGVPIDITSEGHLIIRLQNNHELILNSGEISLLTF